MEGVIIFVIVGIFICGCCAAISEQEQEEEVNQDQDLEERKRAYLELRYDRKKEGDFWRYFYLRKKGKLTYIVPEFEERIVKMNKLKEKDTN